MGFTREEGLPRSKFGVLFPYHMQIEGRGGPATADG